MARTGARAAANDRGANGIARAFETAFKGRPWEHSRAHGLLCGNRRAPRSSVSTSLLVPSFAVVHAPPPQRPAPLGRRPRWARSSLQGEETASRSKKGRDGRMMDVSPCALRTICPGDVMVHKYVPVRRPDKFGIACTFQEH
jgi:hypothetical protein